MKPHITHREETQGGREGVFQPPNSSHPSPPVGVVAGCGVGSSKQ